MSNWPSARGEEPGPRPVKLPDRCRLATLAPEIAGNAIWSYEPARQKLVHDMERAEAGG